MSRHSHSHSPVRTTRRATRRRLAGLAAVLAVPVAALVLAPAAALAHVTVQPGEAEAGSFAVVTFRVPNERDDASTTRVQVVLPEDQPVGSVRTTPVPGWRAAVGARTLDEPIELSGEEVSEVVSEVTWTATGSGVAPEQYQDFGLSIGPLPESGQMVFSAIQTYSGGEEVAWNEVSVDGTTEPEHPAPVLTIVPPADAVAADGAGQPGAAAPGDAADGGVGDGVLPLLLSAIAVVLAGAALVLSARRGRA